MPFKQPQEIERQQEGLKMEPKLSRREILKAAGTTGMILAVGGSILSVTPGMVSAQAQKSIELKPPAGGNAFLQLLSKRSSSREYGSEPLPLNVLSGLLWAAFGINRPESGRRTAPTAVNRQEIDIYVAAANGLYLYDAKSNALKPILSDDIRAQTGRQAYVKEAPINLVYVSDYNKFDKVTEEDKLFYSAADTGFISENVYLYCASEGLATVVRAAIDKPALAKSMKLRPEQRIILAQSVGYPKKNQ
jgi:SagB-type dehydrogenase family enzyme